MNQEVQEKINQIQLAQQNLQNFAMQRQQFQIQQTELESALKELDKTNQTFRIIGNIMVSVDREELKKDLLEKKQTMEIRVSTIEKQENKLKEKAEELQKEIMKELEQKQQSAKPKKESNKHAE